MILAALSIELIVQIFQYKQNFYQNLLFRKLIAKCFSDSLFWNKISKKWFLGVITVEKRGFNQE